LRRESRRLRAYEGAIGRRVDAVLAVSDVDRLALAEVMGGERPITVVPIGVDTDEVRPLRRRPDANRVIHIGTMYWPPNADGVRWFTRAVWPRIRAARPQTRFDVIGARPPRALRTLARPGNGVRFTGYVADPTPHLEGAGVVVVPLLAGSGMRVKILMALAHGLPVVSTTLGCEGIDVEAGRDLLVADTDDAFAAATLRVLNDRTLADQLGRNGRHLIEQRYDYRTVLARLAPIYERRANPARVTT
jgi:glycosyltransferase involved in cell wall biosynthesis